MSASDPVDELRRAVDDLRTRFNELSNITAAQQAAIDSTLQMSRDVINNSSQSEARIIRTVQIAMWVAGALALVATSAGVFGVYRTERTGASVPGQVAQAVATEVLRAVDDTIEGVVEDVAATAVPKAVEDQLDAEVEKSVGEAIASQVPKVVRDEVDVVLDDAVESAVVEEVHDAVADAIETQVPEAVESQAGDAVATAVASENKID